MRTSLKKWENQENYFGDDFSNYYCFLGYGECDYDCLDRSNVDVALERLGGESEGVIKVFFGGFGGHTQILILETAEDKLNVAETILEELKNYPCLDEDDYNEKRSEIVLEDIECWGF